MPRPVVRLIMLLCLVAAGLALADRGGDGEPAMADEATATPVMTGCSGPRVKERVQTFARAIRRADLDALDVVWGNRFKWFSVGFQRKGGGVRDHFLAETPKEALNYIERKEGLPMRLNRIEFNGRYRGAADFEYGGAWRTSRRVSGKGNLLCASPQIRVWSMAVRPRSAKRST